MEACDWTAVVKYQRNSTDFVRVLQETRLEIKPEHRASAFVEIWSRDDLPVLHLGYRRNQTPEEVAADQAERRKHWEVQLKAAEERVQLCRTELENNAASS
jgi:hypothetical protein